MIWIWLKGWVGLLVTVFECGLILFLLGAFVYALLYCMAFIVYYIGRRRK